MTREETWHSIEDPSAADSFLERTRGFHDAVSKKAVWEGKDSIDTEGTLTFGGRGTLRLFLDSQFEDVGSIEIEFEGVRKLSYDHEMDSEGLVRIQPGGPRVELGPWEVEAEKIRYRKL